jgi:hypothetical protein
MLVCLCLDSADSKVTYLLLLFLAQSVTGGTRRIIEALLISAAQRDADVAEWTARFAECMMWLTARRTRRQSAAVKVCASNGRAPTSRHVWQF